MHSLRYGSHDLFELAPEVEELVKAYVIDLKVPWQAELEFGFPKKRSLGMIFHGRLWSCIKFLLSNSYFFWGELEHVWSLFSPTAECYGVQPTTSFGVVWGCVG